MITWEYLAGFTDADGSIGCYSNASDNKARPRITWTQKSVLILDEIQEFLHITLGLAKRPITEYFPPAGGSACNLAIANGDAVEAILTNLIPYLVIKKHVAITALKVLADNGERHSRVYAPRIHKPTAYERAQEMEAR